MASPLETLMQNPAFAAFVTAAGLEEQIVLQDAARRRRGIETALGIQTEQIQESGRRQRRGISSEQESRGMFRSGEHQTALSEQEADQGRSIALQQLAAGDAIGDIESGVLQSGVQRQYGILGKALNAASEETLDAGTLGGIGSGYQIGLPSATATGSLSAQAPAVTKPSSYKPKTNTRRAI